MKNQRTDVIKFLVVFSNLPPHLLFIGSILFITTACNVSEEFNSDFQLVQINLDEKKPADVEIRISEIIPLESVDSSIIGRVCRIQTYEDKIFVLDWVSAKSLFLFDKVGNFIKKIHNGKGPGECFRIDDFCIDYEDRKIFTWDQFLKRLSTFDLNLNYHTSVQKKLINRQFEQLPDESWLIFSNYSLDPPNGQHYAYYLYNKNLDSVKAELLPIPQELTHFSLLDPISREPNQKILFTKQYDQNIYSVENEIFKVEYALDFGKYNVRETDFTGGDYYHPTALAREGERVVNIDRLIHTKDHFAFSFLFKDYEIEYIIYSKAKKKYWYSKHLEEDGKLPEGKLMCMADKRFVLACEPAAFNAFCASFQGNLPSYCRQVDEGGNVVLVLFEIDVK